MSARRARLLRAGSLLLASEILVQACGLLRNLVVARLILPEHFGVAAALAMSVSLVEMLSDVGAGRFLTRAHGHDGDAWLGVAHTVSILRGTLGALALALLAPLLASALDMGDAAWAFRAVALVPLVRAWTHNDIWLAQRDFRFRAYALYQALPQVATLALAAPVALWLRDYRALLLLLVVNASLATLLSHLAGSRPYRLAFDKARTRELLAFGLPLLGDGLLMFVVMHGERVIVSNAFGRAALGFYSATYLLAWTPAAVLGRVGLSLGTPQLSALRHDRARRDAHVALASRLMLAPAIALGIAFALGGGEIVRLVFGDDYRLAPAAAAWLALGQALRILRVVPIVAAIAEGYTLSPLVGNVARALAVAVGFGLAEGGAPLETVLGAGVAGELVAHVLTVFMNRLRLALPARGVVLPVALLGVAFWLAWTLRAVPAFASLGPIPLALVAMGIGAASGTVVLAFSPGARGLARGILKRGGRDSPISQPDATPRAEP